MNEPTPCVSTTQRRKRSLSSGVETYGSPLAAARPIIPSPSAKRARISRSVHAAPRDEAQLALARVVARQQHLRRARQLRRLLDDRGVDVLEVDRGGDRPQRPVDEPLLTAQAGLALEQLGALERERGEAREHLDRAQVLCGRARAAAGWRRSRARRTCARRPSGPGHEMNEAVR